MITQTEKKIEYVDWMDSADVFEYLKISKRTLQTWRDTGVIPFYSFHKKVWYKRSEIDAFLESTKVQRKCNRRLNRSCLPTKKFVK